MSGGARGKARVVHLSSVHPPYDTRIFRKECRSLHDAGYDVTLVVGHERDEDHDGVRLRAVTRGGNRLTRMLATTWRVWRRAASERADLYHFHDPELILVGLALRGGGAKVIYDAHENYAEQIRGKPWLPAPLRGPVAAAASFVERRLAGGFDAVVAAGDDIARVFAGRARRVVTVENFPVPDPALLAAGDEGRERGLVLNYGGVSRQRAAGVLSEALDLLPVGSPVRLILGGSIWAPDLLERMKTRPGWSRVEFKGRVDRAEMSADFRRGWAAVVLYDRSPNHMHIRSNRLYEAMAAGLPVIVSDFPDWRRFMDEHRCGLPVDPDDPRAVAAALQRLHDDPEAARAMGRRGQGAVRERFNWDREAAKLLDLYRELLGEASP